MKTFIRIISFATVAALTLVNLVSCQNRVLPVLTPGQRTASEVVIADFESLNEIRNMNYINEFGRASVNTDKKFITSGSGSIKLDVFGNPSQGQTYYPTFMVYTDKMYNELDKKDFSDVTAFKFDIFNDSDRDIDVSFGFNSAAKENGGGSPRTLYTLKKGEWTKAIIPFISGATAQAYDIKNIDYFMFVFENRKRNETPAKIYIDNFTAEKGGQKEFIKTREQNEVVFFENTADVQMMNSGGIYYHFGGNPMFSLNKNLEYVTQGRSSLKIISKAFGPNPYSGVNDSPVISLNGAALKDICDISKYKSISFDLFNASDRNITIAFYITDGNATYAKYNLNVKKERWNTFEITVEDIKQAINKEKPIDITKITRISWAWNGFQEGTDYIMYLDNVRFAE